VRRVDARNWVEESDGTLHPGLAASSGAGVVRCDLRPGHAEVTGSRIARGLFTPSPTVGDLAAWTTSYTARRVAAAEPAQLLASIQPHLHALEVRVAVEARARGPAEVELLVIDGPLSGHGELPRALGYVKTHRVNYLPPELSTVVGQLRGSQRTPVFLLGTSWHRHTWYLKLPSPPGSPWAGVVRVETSADLPRGAVVALADVSALTLPRFASTAYKDARAPQNLNPIAGLERKLRGMLGDQRLLVRALTAATAAERANTGTAAERANTGTA
jgi:hypothetical protein